jgi:hypothetical protein
MKKFIALCLVLMCAACTTTGQPLVNLPPLKIIPPAQLAAQVCPVLHADLPLLQVPGILDPNLEAQLAVAVPMIEVACANAASIKVVDLQTFVNQGVPFLLKIVQASNLPKEQKQLLVINITIANSLIAPIVQSLEQGTAIVANPTLVAAPIAPIPVVTVAPATVVPNP